MGFVRAILWLFLVALGTFVLLVLVRHGVSGTSATFDAARGEFEALAEWLRVSLGTGA